MPLHTPTNSPPPRTAATSLLALLLSTFPLWATPAQAENCSGATVLDLIGGDSGTAIEHDYLDAAAGGIGANLRFTIPHSSAVDTIMIIGSDGYSLAHSATGTQTVIDVSTQGDGTPATSVSNVAYEVDTLASGIGGTTCELTATFAPPTCTITSTPNPPTVGINWQIRVDATNVLYNAVDDNFGTLASTASAFPGLIELDGISSVSGTTLLFDPAHQVASFSTMDDGTYTTSITGPGAVGAQCDYSTLPALTFIETDDAGDHTNPQATGSPAERGRSLIAIQGALSLNDSVDIYCIKIPDPSLFYATTSPFDDGSASAGWDTRMFVLSPSGAGLSANDDTPSGGFGSTLMSSSNFPGTTLNSPLLPSGELLLAINAFPDEPQNGAGNLIFDLNAAQALHGPLVPGDPVVNWSSTSTQGAAYTIALGGAEVCDAVPIFSDGFEFGSVVAWQ